MVLTEKELRNKISGCWEGKNIGGVFGAPFEMYRGLVDATFYTQDLTKGIPANDDLDLQLIWLNAAEKYGYTLDSDILAEYWLTYEIDNSSEYGTAKSNLRSGLQPPLSGLMGNSFKNSNGAFIRTEIWACLAPGDPEFAVRMCYEDAIVDHAYEGVYAAAFCAAIESAAFFESDINRLVEIGQSYIPSDCSVYKAVEKIKDMYKANKTIEEMRSMLLTDFPSYFSLFNKHPWEVKDNFPLGEVGFDAPVQIGIIVGALLIGQGDFEKTIISAVRCGEDADCTAATAGAIIGIIKGADNLPAKWRDPLGHVIETVCINLRVGLNVPRTTDELTERVIRLLPVFNDGERCKIGKDGICIYSEKPEPYSMRDLYYRGNYGMENMKIHDLLTLAPYKKVYKNYAFNTVIDYQKEPMIEVGETVIIGITLYNQNMDRAMYPICIKVLADAELTINSNSYMRAFTTNNYETKSELEVRFTVNEAKKPYVDVYLDMTVEGRSVNQIIKCRYYFK